MVASEKELIEDSQDSGEFHAPAGWSPAAVYETAALAHEAGLAILAMGHAYWLLPDGENFIICVATGKLPEVQRELEVMERMRKRTGSHPAAVVPNELSVSVWSFLVYALLLTGCFVAQSYFPLTSAGRVDAALMVEEGEWWRTVTALTLHADVVHLVSNLVAGLGFALLLSRFFGAGAAWLMILITGALGNGLNAWIHYPETHLSIGASTAVFAALGIITGVGFFLALRQPAERWTMPRWLLPAFGGLTLLGLLGVGEGIDDRVDVAAHISGFLCGSLAGFVGAARQANFVRWSKHGKWLGLSVLLVIAGAWCLALL